MLKERNFEFKINELMYDALMGAINTMGLAVSGFDSMNLLQSMLDTTAGARVVEANMTFEDYKKSRNKHVRARYGSYLILRSRKDREYF
jgi:hypothetical protein